VIENLEKPNHAAAAERQESTTMSENVPFEEFLRRIRAGDARAAEELVRLYEPAIRLEVRMRLGDSRLRRVFDSLDICQSVLGSFFLRARAGQYDLTQPQDLIKLLAAMTRNKVAFEARKQHAKRRDNRRNQGMDAAAADLPGAEPSPSRIIANEELVQMFRDRLSEEERQLADRRADEQSWAEIAGAMGGTAQARRKQLERAVDRVLRQLGMDEGAEE